MQGNQRVEKFKKAPRTYLMDSNQEATITTGKKYNKTKRGGGIKGAFRNADDSYINAGKVDGGVL